jgi:hypothetical protein
MVGITVAEDKPKLSINSPKLTTAQELNLDGTDGIWLPKDMADKALSDLELIPRLEEKISHLESALLVRSERMENFKRGMENESQAKTNAIRALQIADIAKTEAEKKLSVWYRNPFVWLGVGLFIGIGVETSVILAVRK